MGSRTRKQEGKQSAPSEDPSETSLGLSTLLTKSRRASILIRGRGIAAWADGSVLGHTVLRVMISLASSIPLVNTRRAIAGSILGDFIAVGLRHLVALFLFLVLELLQAEETEQTKESKLLLFLESQRSEKLGSRTRK